MPKAKPVALPAVITTPADLERYTAAIKAGDTKARGILRAQMQDNAELRNQYGLLGRRLRDRFIQAIVPSAPHFIEATLAQADALIDELAPDPQNTLDRLLAERIAVSAIHLRMDEVALQTAQAPEGTGNIDTLQDRREKSEKAYIRAILALAKVRKLRLPTLQLNVANQQIVNQGATP